MYLLTQKCNMADTYRNSSESKMVYGEFKVIINLAKALNSGRYQL